MPTVSLCLIVKNEEKYLAPCLASARAGVDEIIVVDTGSTDRTLEIAAEFGARIFQHPWEKHFSKHRNQSIGYAQGDWILWLDADEALQPGAEPILREAIRNTACDSFMTTMICYFDNRTRTSWNNTLKLFKNRQGIHFQGAVHNQVVGFKNAGFCPLKIFHYGYDQDRKSIQKKFERTSLLLQNAIREEPENFRHYHDLAVSFSSMNRFAKTLSVGLKAVECYRANQEHDPNILWTYFVVASAAFNLGRLDQAQAYAEQALRLNPEHLDSHFVLASVCAARKDRPGFESSYRIFSNLAPEYRAHPERLAGLVLNKLDEQWRLDLEYAALLLADHLKAEA
ncbi:MAG: glycosyltransferase, partial [Desulfobacteraceae bacterium]